ncbi:carbon-nitrogen hydrolase family protein [Neisseriaceae bacterium JH1-16]|nr:carbon-nitrogen hydrolase family protein [Neisseriaceae bacterium JH1-16]
MRVELAQLPTRDGDVDANIASARQAIADCAADTSLIVFPESHLMGFPSKDNIAALAQPLSGPALSAIQQAASAKGVSVAIGLTEALDGQFFNTTVLLTPAGLATAYRKTHLWPSEHGIVSAGNTLMSCEWNGLRVGLLICYDIEFPETARALASLGVDLLIVTNGNMAPYGPVHRNAIVARAMENQVFAVMVNRCGQEGGLTFTGESAVIDPFGRIVASCGSGPEQLGVGLDLSLLATSREPYRYLSDRRIALRGEVQDFGQGQTGFSLER